MAKAKAQGKMIANNKKAYHDYLSWILMRRELHLQVRK